jgi:hypothetical protein
VYGQILSELGFLGVFIFTFLIFSSYRTFNSKDIINPLQEETGWKWYSELMKYWLFSFMVFGYASHNLYSWYWLFLFTIAAILKKLHREEVYVHKYC